jgi:NAD-dependent SIR2 family protein deacetylase
MLSITDRIASGEFKNIIIVTGAGISVNAGIPDYRSVTGTFAELLKIFPQAENPSNLFSRAFIEKYDVHNHPVYIEKIKLIEQAEPTPTHIFCKYLYDNKWLRRIYTQNIDGLHQKAGVPDNYVVEYHGSILKNNMVLYGDAIPGMATRQTIDDFTNPIPVDLMLVMGTSLQVAPFCAIPNLVNKSCVRILVDINPKNAFTNDWSIQKNNPDEMYKSPTSLSTIKIGNRVVSLRPQWQKPGKWKDQYVITSDCDVWVSNIK